MSTPERCYLTASSCHESPDVLVRVVTPKNDIALSKPLMTQIDMQAECYFIANFVRIPEAGPSKGYLDFVIPLLNAENSSRCLPLAFSAVTLVAFASFQNSIASLLRSRMIYLQALNEINIALRDPEQSLHDSLVASVLLLAKFEASFFLFVEIGVAFLT